MRAQNLLYSSNITVFLESLLPDFVLAFAFFTSLIYAVLGKKFDHQRSAITMSACLSLALSVGLVWWEKANNLSIKNLGPVAVGFAIIILAFVMYKSIRHIGGSWAGAGITLGVSILIAKVIGMNIPIDTEVIQSITVTALIIGIFAFLMHTAPHKIHAAKGYFESPETKIDMTRLFRERHLSNDLSRKMKKVRKQAALLNDHPEDAGNILLQIKRILPAEGYLTERMAQLRAKAHQIRNGHIARLEETRSVFAKLPASAKKKASEELTARYNQLIGIDTRLERLDKTVAENEKYIRQTLQAAQDYTRRFEHEKLVDCLKQAQKLQQHNSRIIKIIDRTQSKLSAIAKQIAKETREVNKK